MRRLLLLSLLFVAPLRAEFTEAQTEELHGIIHSYLLDNPEVLVEVSQKLQAQQQEEAMSEARVAVMDNASELFEGDFPELGNPDGEVTVIQFFDYECPHCRRMYPVLKTLIATNPDVRVINLEFPILGMGSLYLAKASLAADRQGKYKELHELFMQRQGRPPVTEDSVVAMAKTVGIDVDKLKEDIKDPDIGEKIRKVHALAAKLGVRATPHFIVAAKPVRKKSIFVLPGGLPLEAFEATIKKAKEAEE